MSEVKQVKVDNWGIFFLQRLKHFFNRTDYCDLTLQFLDNAQLKVHRLVLSACTEYFELLERTCEMYEDCLVMPDDLQADVVVPIVNFMYTGQLEFRMDLLERLYQTSLVMNMPVLTKLLDAHRLHQINKEGTSNSYTNPKRFKSYDSPKQFSTPSSSNVSNNKRSYGKAFENNTSIQNYRKTTVNKSDLEISDTMPYSNPASIDYRGAIPKKQYADPRPTRYELPEELESDNLFDSSFSNISYTSKPLMVHPESTKHYPSKRTGIFEDPSTSKRFIHGRTTMDIVECKKISVGDNIYDEELNESICDEQDTYRQQMLSIKGDSRDSSQLFDQILDNGGPKLTIETKDTKQSNNLDHAKIISEVLKKYPHLVKSNKNIKLKILNTPSKKKTRPLNSNEEEKEVKQKVKTENEYTFETDVLDSKEAGKLIALGAENIKGPWICLICAAPGKAIHFTSYYKFRRHLVEVHNEKPVLNICEYCGQKAMKRNFLLHHLYTKHGVEPPPQYNFPKCNICNYVALTEGFLIKHKFTHTENQTFRCNVCFAAFSTSNQLLIHIQKTGHKYSDKKTNLQCIYCLKVFLRECNLYAHLRTYHKNEAKNDGIIDISDDEKPDIKEREKPMHIKTSHKQEIVKYEAPITFENDYDDADVQYQIQQQPDGNIQVVSKKPRVLLPTKKQHKILNAGLSTPSPKVEQKPKFLKTNQSKQNEYIHNSSMSMNNQSEEIVVIDHNEYIVKDNHLIPKKDKSTVRETYTMPDIIHMDVEETTQNIIPTSVEYTTVQTANPEEHKMTKKTSNINQPIQIVVSNEEEYKALMASNHSIIFEDGDSSKTLTVLTTPDTNAIDLDNTQSNDMMIIQDHHYPLNVSEAVTGDNSNIVVVYSHAVDDQNKEFQLITSQNLGAQFVTTSGIITQNYETVTTSAPAANAQIIETPVDESWQNDIPQNISADTEIEIPVNDNQVTDSTIETELSSVVNLQEVPIPSDTSKHVEIQPNVEHLNQVNIEHLIAEPHVVKNINETGNVIISDAQPHVINTCVPQPVFTDAIDSVPSVNLIANDSTHHPAEVKENIENSIEDLLGDKEKDPDDNMDIEKTLTENKAEAVLLPVDETLASIQENIKEDSNDSETIENIAKAIQSSASVSITIPTDKEVHTSVVIEPIIGRDLPTVKAKEQIQSLTSEWSDDEMESLNQDRRIIQEDDNKEKIDAECNDTVETDSQPYLEESIENIQHEIQKQLSRSAAAAALQAVESLAVVDGNKTLSQLAINRLNDQEKEFYNKTVASNESTKAPDKISSLLNDWEDNDSHEEDILEAKKKENTGRNDRNSPTNEIQSMNSIDVIIEPLTGKRDPDPKAGENIKSLVSDWVDDEDYEEDESK